MRKIMRVNATEKDQHGDKEEGRADEEDDQRETEKLCERREMGLMWATTVSPVKWRCDVRHRWSRRYRNQG